MTTTTTPADIIAQQLGSGAIYMLGARGRCTRSTDGRELTMRIKGCRKINAISIELDDSDTYTVRFRKYTADRWNARKGEYSTARDTVVCETSFVQAESLHDVIESTTGLYTRL